MTSTILTFPLRYLLLTDERGSKLIWSDLVAIVIVTAAISIPFIAYSHSNYFHNDGFLDRVAGFSSVLTGFYVAGLVAVAAFGKEVNGLDKVIVVGPILMPATNKSEEPEHLTRREYVCLMFGFLAFLSLSLTLAAIMIVTVLGSVAPLKFDPIQICRLFQIDRAFLRSTVIIAFGTVISSMAVTTFHGLYYLIDRLYATSPTIKPKPKKTDVENGQ